MISAIALAALLGTTTARPASPLHWPDVVARQTETKTPLTTTAPDNTTDAAGWCAFENTIERVEELWLDWGIGDYLDMLVDDDESDDWLSDLANSFLPSEEFGDAGSYGCGFRGQTCLGGAPQCPEMTARGGPRIHWIFDAVKKMQALFEHANTELTTATVLGNLNVDGISSLLSVDMPPPANIGGILSTSFGIAAAGASLVPVYGTAASAGLSIVSAAFGAIPEPESGGGGQVDEGAMTTALRNMFDNLVGTMDDILALAVGQGDGNYDLLPRLGQCYNGAECETSIAAFFGKGTMLLQGEDVNISYDSALTIINKKLLDIGTLRNPCFSND
jgi:hypothetical protein